MFDNLVWQPDRLLIGDLVFRLQHYLSDDWDRGDECFVFYKVRGLIDQYARFFARLPSFAARNIFELGLWDGGSLAFWFEQFQPVKHVGVDITRRTGGDVISSVTVYGGFAAIERGVGEIGPPERFSLEERIFRRRDPSRAGAFAQSLRDRLRGSA